MVKSPETTQSMVRPNILRGRRVAESMRLGHAGGCRVTRHLEGADTNCWHPFMPDFPMGFALGVGAADSTIIDCHVSEASGSRSESLGLHLLFWLGEVRKARSAHTKY